MLNVAKIKDLQTDRGWSEVDLARRLGLDYSFVYRVMRGARNPGKKFYEGLFMLCNKENLSIEEFVSYQQATTS